MRNLMNLIFKELDDDRNRKLTIILQTKPKKCNIL